MPISCVRRALYAKAGACKAVGGQAGARCHGRLGPAGRGPLRCSRPKGGSAPRPRAGATLLAQRRCARSSTCSPPRRACARRDAPRSAALLGALQARPGLPAHSLAGTTVACVGKHHERLCAVGGARWGRLVARREAQQRKGESGPQGPDRRGAVKSWRVQRRDERYRSRPCDASIAAKSARRADRDSRSHHRAPPTAPRRTPSIHHGAKQLIPPTPARPPIAAPSSSAARTPPVARPWRPRAASIGRAHPRPRGG